jgi:hypothetical protein
MRRAKKISPRLQRGEIYSQQIESGQPFGTT